jgi:hypothetical protein
MSTYAYGKIDHVSDQLKQGQDNSGMQILGSGFLLCGYSMRHDFAAKE